MKFLKNKKTKFALILASACLIITLGYTFAYYNSTISISNKMATKQPQVELIEKFSQGVEFLPGEKVDKQVKFANSGDSDALIRVRYSDMWSDIDGNKVSGNTDLVTKEWTNAWQNEWIDGGDGYFYYTKVLKVQTQTNIILDRLVLSDSASNDSHDFDYSNLIYQITFELESCSVSDEETKNNFNKSVTISGDNVTWSNYDGGSKINSDRGN